MPLPVETESRIRKGYVDTDPVADLNKFLIYAWEGQPKEGGGNWKITMPLSVVSRTPFQLRLSGNRAEGTEKTDNGEPQRKEDLPPRITLGKPIPPEPPIVMGGGVPIEGLSAGSRIDPETKKRSDEYQLLRSQPLPAQERHEYQAYPQNCERTSDLPIYHSYLALSWLYLGLKEQLLSCLNYLDLVCVAHHLPEELLMESLPFGNPLGNSNSSSNPSRKEVRLGSAFRHRVEAFISQGRVAFLVGNLRAVALQIEWFTGVPLSENEIRELETFQTFEELAALDRGLPVLYLYPFANIYEMERAEELHGNSNPHSKEIVQPLRELRCLLEPGPLQKKLEQHADPSLHW